MTVTIREQNTESSFGSSPVHAQVFELALVNAASHPRRGQECFDPVRVSTHILISYSVFLSNAFIVP